MEEKKSRSDDEVGSESRMTTNRGIFDVFKFRNIPYSELEDRYARKRIESWVSRLSVQPELTRALIDSNGFIDISPLDANVEYTHDGIKAELFAEVLKITFPEFL